MKIAIEALGIHYYGGGRTAIINLLDALFSLDKDNDYLVFLSHPDSTTFNKFKNVEIKVVNWRNRFSLRLWAQFFIPGLTRDFDLIHFTKNLGIFGQRTASVVTIHDLTTLIHPELFPKLDVLYWKYIQKHTLNTASKIIAVSQNTAKDIKEYYNIHPNRIKVIYNAISPIFTPASSSEINKMRIKYKIPANYLIHVGRIDKKKNLTFLVEVFEKLRKMVSNDIKLVLVG